MSSIQLCIYSVHSAYWWSTETETSSSLLYMAIKKSLCTWRTMSTQLMSWRWPSQNTFGMWTVLYWTPSSRTQFGVSINVWRLAGDTLNIIGNFLYCNHQVRREFLITLYNVKCNVVLTEFILRKATVSFIMSLSLSVCLSVCAQVTTQIPLDEFLWNLIFEDCFFNLSRIFKLH